MHERSAMASGSQVPGRRHLTPYFTGVPALDVEQERSTAHFVAAFFGLDAMSLWCGRVAWFCLGAMRR